jgi:hypothetical protein
LGTFEPALCPPPERGPSTDLTLLPAGAPVRALARRPTLAVTPSEVQYQRQAQLRALFINNTRDARFDGTVITAPAADSRKGRRVRRGWRQVMHDGPRLGIIGTTRPPSWRRTTSLIMCIEIDGVVANYSAQQQSGCLRHAVSAPNVQPLRKFREKFAARTRSAQPWRRRIAE